MAASAAAYPDNTFSPDVLAALPDATSWTLLSIDPGPYKKTADEFHGYPVLGRLPLSNSKATLNAIHEIVEAARNWDNSIALCFWPRHGLSAILKDGRRVDFVICYECVQAKMFVDGEFGDIVHFGTKRTKISPAPLNDLLKAHNIPMPPQPD